jgi:hypothetical protein
MKKECSDGSYNGNDDRGSASLQSDSGSNSLTLTEINLSKMPSSTEENKRVSNSGSNANSTLTPNYKKKSKEVSRKGNGMGDSGWKSQFCMNGISFCFKVGSLFLDGVSLFVHVIHGLIVNEDARVGNFGNCCTTRKADAILKIISP